MPFLSFIFLLLLRPFLWNFFLLLNFLLGLMSWTCIWRSNTKLSDSFSPDDTHAETQWGASFASVLFYAPQTHSGRVCAAQSVSSTQRNRRRCALGRLTFDFKQCRAGQKSWKLYLWGLDWLGLGQQLCANECASMWWFLCIPKESHLKSWEKTRTAGLQPTERNP